MNGFIKLHRQLPEWEWYTDIKVKSLFLHCLLMANFKDKKWQGITIKRGQFATSIGKLAIETGISEKSVRTALEKLEKTGETARSSTSKFTIITVCKYDSYQESEQEEKDTEGQTNGKPTANERQTNGKRRANEGQQLKNDKKDKKEKNDKKKDIVDSDESTPPDIKFFLEVARYFKKVTGKNIKIPNTNSKIMRSDKYKRITARMVEDATVEDCKKVIDLKYHQWKDDNKMKQYIAIPTLFAKSNFEKYLDEAENTDTPQQVTDYVFPYELPKFTDESKRFDYFLLRFNEYKNKIDRQEWNEYRKKALYGKEAENVCKELETKYPNLSKIQVQWQHTT